ncbi:phage holin family protein [Candidatus Roizmanbacteria bacterium]|nr:phage holin family protein [Candidatus Roizmanbacteria bacterium]
MKKIFRKIVFSGIAIYVTSLWNKGFIIQNDWMFYLKASLVIASIYYLIVPVSKLVLLPLNIITLGLVSVVFYALVLYFFMDKFSLIQIKPWDFDGLKLFGMIITPLKINQLTNIFLSAFSISTIINSLEKIL